MYTIVACISAQITQGQNTIKFIQTSRIGSLSFPNFPYFYRQGLEELETRII